MVSLSDRYVAREELSALLWTLAKRGWTSASPEQPVAVPADWQGPVINASSTLVEVAFEVCTALDASGYTAVLTGGSAATFYAPAATSPATSTS